METEQSKGFRARYIGKEVEVLFEEAKVIAGTTYQIGHTKDYVKVAFATDENLSNSMKIVKIDSFLNDEVLLALNFTDK